MALFMDDEVFQIADDDYGSEFNQAASSAIPAERRATINADLERIASILRETGDIKPDGQAGRVA